MSSSESTMEIIAFDTETHLIEAGNIAPDMVCATFASHAPEQIETEIMASCDPQLPDLMLELLTNPNTIIVGQFTAYDMAVLAKKYPQLIPAIFAAYGEQRVWCLKIREKLLNLSIIGSITNMPTDDGSSIPIRYGMKELVLKYEGEDISDSKDAKDSWRLNFKLLDGKPTSEYPPEASDYAKKDAKHTLVICDQQDVRAVEMGGTMETHAFQAAIDFALYLVTCRGIRIDQESVAMITSIIAEDLVPEKQRLLIASGILDPGEPPRPHKNNPERMTAGKDPSIKRIKLQERVKLVCEAYGLPVKTTEGRINKKTGEREEGISTDEEVMENIAHLDDVLWEYKMRQQTQKLVTTELPRIQAPFVYPSFDVLKETGRTSSMASDLFPSCNIQNVDPRVRPCYLAREGMLFLSVDYSSIELVTKAQKELEIFGHSALADLINSGEDPHGFLGAQMAYAFDEPFRNACDHAGTETKMDIYKVFKAMKKSEDKPTREFYDKYRTFAKPTGLGYPGGLGAETFVTFAKATYGIVITIEQAEQFKLIWKDSFPEAQMCFDWLSRSLKDPFEPNKYQYTTPLGMVRSRASYCAASNGNFMQSPAAEGGKLALYTVVEATINPAANNQLLFGSGVVAWIHDEILMEIPDDEFSHERACEVQRIMSECMGKITPDMTVRTEAKLMRRWYKQAKPVFDKNNRLTVWEPE